MAAKRGGLKSGWNLNLLNLQLLDEAERSGDCSTCNPWKDGRGGEIRTHDLLYPKQAR